MNTNKKNVAFIISGAAAFIPQEIACIKAIVEATFPNAQEKINPTVISGTSSGSICTVLLNGVLAGKITWDQLENDIIPSIGNSSVFNNELFQKAILFSAINALTKTKGVIKDSEQLYNDIIVIFKDYKHLKPLELFKQLIKVSKDIITDFDEIKELVTTIKNLIEKIKNYDFKEVKAAFDQILHNIEKGFILDTAPLVQTFHKYVNETMGFNTMSDLPVRTIISAVENSTGSERRFDSEKKAASDPITDVLLASTAIPVVFPKRQVNNEYYVDGGTGTDNIPVEDVLATGEKFDEVYVITHMNERILNRPIKHSVKSIPILSNFLFAFQVLSSGVLPFQLSQAIHLTHDPNNAYLYMPILEKSFSALDFDSMPEQLKLATQFCLKNGPRKISDVLKEMNFPIPRPMVLAD